MQKGFSALIVLIGLIILAGLAYGGYSYFQQQKIKNINSFEGCAKLYPVMESYPAQCNTPDGRHFVQELTDEEKKKLVPPTIDETGDWGIYKASNLYEIKYPLDKYSVSKGFANIDAYWPGIIDIEPNDIFNQQKPAAVTYQVSIGIKENKEKYTKETLDQYFGNGLFIQYGGDSLKDAEIKKTMLGGVDALRIDGCCGGQAGVEANIISLKGNKIYEIMVVPIQVSGDPEKNKDIYEQVISTFKFLDQNQTEKEGEDYIMFNGRKLMIKRVQEGESCQGFVGSQQTYYPKCDTGLKCQFREGTIQDAPGICTKSNE